METENEEIVLTYEGEEAESQDFATQLFVVLTMGIDEITDENVKEAEELDLNDFKLEIIMDNSDYLLKDLTMSMHTEQEGEDHLIDFDYEYSKYNEELDITPLKETTDEKAEPKEEPKTDPDLNEEDAAAYLDALLQATVYQDVDGYIKALPKSMEDSDNKKAGKVQEEVFKSFYLENTKQNMAEFDIKDEKYEALADAFLRALNKTKYDIVSTKIEDDRVVVTLSVEGINDSKLYEETNEKLAEVAEKENLGIDEVADKNIDMLIDAYKDIEITEPKDIEVNVSKLGGGYQVLLQDEFLIDGFVQ